VPLLGHVMRLFVMIGLTEGGTVERLSKPLYREVLRVLRTAESAVRRLIFVAARNIVVEPPAQRTAQAERKSPGKSKDQSKDNGNGQGEGKRKRRVLFRLFDPPKRFRKVLGRWPKPRQAVPRVHFFPADPRAPIFRLFRQPQPEPQPAAPAPPAPVVQEADATVDDGTVNARHLCRRLFAIVDALEDIPRQAMRLARWRSRPVEERRPPRSSPLRSGRPPGHRKRHIHEVDEILKECHWLARNVEPPLDDTS
jgi:hypothetical protein